jgi:hypothetical protein
MIKMKSVQTIQSKFSPYLYDYKMIFPEFPLFKYLSNLVHFIEIIQIKSHKISYSGNSVILAITFESRSFFDIIYSLSFSEYSILLNYVCQFSFFIEEIFLSTLQYSKKLLFYRKVKT